MPKDSGSSWGIWVGAIVLIAAALGVIVLLAGKNPIANQQAISTAIAAEDHVLGDRNSKVVLMEYGDYQCPACATVDPLTQQITGEFGDKIAYVYRHFPLRTIHRNADLSAQAAEAAGKQGKFWEMHHLLYAQQTEWDDAANAKDIFLRYAETLQLDRAKFESDMAAGETMARINRDVQSGTAALIQGTPTFFLNGSPIALQSGEQFRALVQQAVDSAQ